jgi:hypothetical protein
MKSKKIIRKTLLISGVFLSILLMVSSATALQIVNKTSLEDEKIVENETKKELIDTTLAESIDAFSDSEKINSKLESMLNSIEKQLSEQEIKDLNEIKDKIIQIIENKDIKSLEDLEEVEPCGIVGVVLGVLTWPLAVLLFGVLEIITVILWVIVEIVGIIIATILLPWVNLFPALISITDVLFGLSWLYIQAILYWPEIVGAFFPL